MLRSQLSLAAVILLLSATTLMLAAAQAPPPDCKESCGDVSIPYPFGLTDGCYLYVPGQESQQFKLACNTTASQPTLNFLNSNKFPSIISNIFAGESALQVMVTSSRNCYNSTMYRDSELYLPPSYTLADKNKVFIVGCNKVTKVIGYPLHVTNPKQPFEVRFSGVSLCQDELGKIFPETCNGFGCSENSIPSGLQNYTVSVWTLGNSIGTTAQWGLDYPCSYSFVVDERNFTFAGNQSFLDLNGTREELPVLAGWAIGNDNCEAAKKKNETAFACKGVNTKCVERADGYFCQCEDGYQGNPYLLDNCLDVDECKNKTLCSDHATCKNSNGGYNCDCHKGYRNDDNDKNKCVLITETNSKNDKEMKISLGVSLSFLVVLIITFWRYHVLKNRKFNMLKAFYVERNGGSLFQQELKKYEGSQKGPRIFTLEELMKATNKFDDTKMIGQGAYGWVYKGTLPENKVVAIKKSKSDAPTVTSEVHQKQFVNEMIVLSGIDHKNVVTLLGCCLENETPILVYEFVSNGTLYEHIHKRYGRGPLSFEKRVKIATETAESLAYLHHHHSAQILHRNVKSSNILLDQNFTAKVADYGALKLDPDDQDQLATSVQGTLGYLDPEFYQSHTLTEKSDVYSFGVVLVELLTSEAAISQKKPEIERNLANFFVTSVKEDRLVQILDHDIIKEGSYEIAEQVAHLAKKCVSSKGEDRPTMKEVEMELGTILAVLMAKQPGGKPDSSPKETEHLLATSPSNAYVVDVRSDEGEVITSIDYDKSIQNHPQMMKPYDGGR